MNDSSIVNSKQVFQKALKLSIISMIGYAIIGGVVGYLWLGDPGLYSFIIGAILTLLFSGLTIISILIASNFQVGGFFGIVLGSWLLKLVLFILALFFLKDQPFVDNLAVFVALVGAILVTIVIDAYTVFSSRMPYVSE